MERYEIQVVGHVDSRRGRTLGCEPVLNLENGSALLRFPPLDQAALYGLLARLRDAGIELVGLRRLAPSDASGAPSIATNG